MAKSKRCREVGGTYDRQGWMAVILLVLLPLCLTDVLGQGAPFFCNRICLAGTLEGGLFLVLLDRSDPCHSLYAECLG